ncbi:MAG: 50S ribosomal protein L29 [Rhodothermales bacterium]|nr:50S ribosomal protein L29 [Rhodothermales bacterium]
MKAEEIREMTTDEIRQRIADEKDQLSHMTFQHAVAELPNPMVLRYKRKLIARLNSILAEKQIDNN